VQQSKTRCDAHGDVRQPVTRPTRPGVRRKNFTLSTPEVLAMIRTLVALTAALLVTPATAAAATFPVGHTVKRMTVPGTLPQETREVDVHVWYPADAAGFTSAAPTVYRSALYGDTRLPAGWKPLSWSLQSKVAREAAVAQQGKPYPVVVFSTGNQNDPIDYAYTLELIAAGGFVVAAPYHANNTADDVRIDYINQQAGTRLINCNDGLPPRTTFGPGDCSKTSVPNSIADRVRDVSYVLNALPGWLGNRVDVAQAGVFGHSRGTITALTAAGGSTVWGVAPERRVQAIMGVSIGVQAIASQISLANVKVPALLAAGLLDATSPPAVSKFAYDNISSVDKRYLEIPNAHHRTFDSTYCDQAQAAGAIVKGDPARMVDKHTFDLLATHPTSGRTQDFCPYSAFTSPTDITALLQAANGFAVTPANVPTTGLTVDPVKQQVADLAVEFFTAKLARAASGGVSGTVPATLSLTLGTAPSFGAFTPGVTRTYTATATATVISSAGDAALSVTDPSTTAPGRLVNGTFSLPTPLLVGGNPLPTVVKTWSGPASNDPVQIGFSQTIGANDALRTGTYSKTLTFTLSTTTP
jgi:predicted dienelactone hydrolase